MALQTTIDISVDFCDKKYILINAKQYDRDSRLISVTCYNHGEIYHLNSSEHSAYIRYKKPDNNSVFNFCEINNRGKVIIKLTEQMLASDGICYADLVIVNKGNAVVDGETGNIVAVNNAAIISTMTFCIDVSETAVANSEIESSYEYNAFNDMMERVEADYSHVALLAKSYSSGGTGLRIGEETDNAKYYSDLALKHVLGDIGNSLVTGIRGSSESIYRKGNVVITANNVGAIPTADIATVSEIKSYLGIE